MSRTAREEREEQFWDEHVPPLEVCLRQVEAGPEPNTRALLDALEPLEGRTALDIGCGGGVLSAWLAQRGARVTGIDVSPASVARARELAAALDLDIAFLDEGFPSAELDGIQFDRLAGKYVLHHLDLSVATPALARSLAEGGRAAFVETMATNPVLRLARRLAGRFGIRRFGTEDEHPLGRRELAQLAGAFGSLRIEVAQLRFFRILDRQVLRYRRPRISRLLGRLDDLLLSLGLTGASYHQLLVLSARPDADGPR